MRRLQEGAARGERVAEAQNSLWSNVKTLVWTIVSVLAGKAP